MHKYSKKRALPAAPQGGTAALTGRAKKNSPRGAAELLGAALGLFPLFLAFWTLAPFEGSASPGLILWLCFAALLVLMAWRRTPFAGLLLVTLQDGAARHAGQNAYLFAIPLFFLLLLALELWLTRRRKKRFPVLLRQSRDPLWIPPGFYLGAAIVMTLHQTAGYFAVAARGAGVWALLQSYRAAGFYPNWRTVLFSTIMMVVLITYPRKFKRLQKILPAAFVGLVLVTALNFLLNPNPVRSTVPELSRSVALPFFFGRSPVSALSMLLIFTAWEEVPRGRLRAVFQEKQPLALALVFLAPAVMLAFDHFVALCLLALVLCAQNIVPQRNRNADRAASKHAP
ncbi:MAG: hypothetical protein LBQ33_03615 [Oscillospiraceae bacterium]|nr:hypothetical protein [Oscillospiraceae bacterium]